MAGQGVAEVVEALQLLGRRWSWEVLERLAETGPTRFAELHRAIPGMSEQMMLKRLRELSDAALVERRVEPGPPITATYQATDLGRGAVERARELGTFITREARPKAA